LVNCSATSIRIALLDVGRSAGRRSRSHQQQAQAAAFSFSRSCAHIGLGVARPGDAELAQPLGDGFRPRSRRVKVSSSKKNSFTCGNSRFGLGDLVDHVRHGARA